LFVLFSELRRQTSILKVKDFNIGLGLTSSHEITEFMDGDIKLKQSDKGLTVFGFKFPVRVEVIEGADPTFHPRLSQVFGDQGEYSPQIREYL